MVFGLFNRFNKKANSGTNPQEVNQPSPWDELSKLQMNQAEKSGQPQTKETTWEDLKELKMKEPIPEKLEQIEVDGIINADNPDAIKKYRDNLNFLANKIKKEGRQDKFLLIREDDNFPHDYKWEMSSSFTQAEPIKNPLTEALRRAIVKQNHPEEIKQKPKTTWGFEIPGQEQEDSEQIIKEAKQLDESIGAIYGPAHFRSTKHFTINTALGHTINSVESNRNFTIIDTIDNFKNSPYRYSLDYGDAYLDLAHERLELSEDAVIFMNKERYEKLKNDKNLMEEINGRKLVRYTGDESTAINMYLSEQGIFPNNAGNIYHEHDPEVYDILKSSIQNLAKETDTPYGLNHGNIDGGGGHFTAYFDDNNRDFANWQHDFITALSEKFPDNKDVRDVMSKPYVAKRFVEEVGTEKVMAAINGINQNFREKAKAEREQYYKEHENMSAEDKQLMRNTVRRIRDYFEGTENYAYSHEREAYRAIEVFYQSKSVKEQLEAARQLNQYFDQHPKQN